MFHYPQMIKNYQFKVGKKGRRIRRNLHHRAPKLIKGSILLLISCVSLSFLGVMGYLMFRSPFFQIKEVKVYGCSRLQRDRVVEPSDLKGRNILSLNLKQVARKIEQERWIKNVVVKRGLPDRIEIYLRERRPIALINLGDIYLVDEDGIVFRKVKSGEYFDLPILTGLGRKYLQRDPQKFIHLIRQALVLLYLLDEKMGLSQDKISEIHIDGDIGFSLFDVESTTQIKLGFSEFREKLERFKRVKEVMDKEITPRVIDLRYEDKIYVTLDERDNIVHGSKGVRKNG